MKSRLIGFIAAVVILIGGAYSLQSQALIDQLRISGNWALMGDFFVDEEGNYIYVQEVYASEGLRPNVRYSDLGLTVGNQVLDRASGIEAGSPVPGDELIVYDYFILKISPEFELLDYQVISQTGWIQDVSYQGGKLGFVFMSSEDAPLHIGDEVYHTDLDSNAGRWGVILNNDLEVEWVASFPSRSVDQICPAGAGDSSVYLGVYFNEYDREVIVLGDTLVNYGYRRQYNDHVYYSHYHSNVFYKYDYNRDTAIWTSRIGSDKSYTKIIDIQLNKYNDPLFLAQASGTQTSIGDNFEDTVEIYGGREPYLHGDCVIFNIDEATGKVYWATSTPEARNDIPRAFKQGSDGSIYVRASLRYGDTLRIRDTILIQPIGLETSWSKSKQGIVKFDSVGVFQWIHQIEGGYDRTSIYSFRVDDNFDQVIVSTRLDGGYGYFGDTLFETIADSDRRHTASVHYGISTEEGAVEDFYYGSFGRGGAQIFEIEKEEAGRWRGILDHAEELFFGQEIRGVSVLFFQADPNAIVSAIEQAKEMPLTLYPNPAPAGDRIRLDGLKGIRDIQAIHISGRPAAIRWSAHAHGAELYFSDALPSGLYLLQVETEEGIQYAKIQVQ